MKTKLKICGITTPEDANSLVQLGVHATGINFYKKSKRYISPQNAQRFLKLLSGKIERIGVFVNEDISTIKQLITNNLIDAAQLHGNEDDTYCQELADNDMEFIRVIRVKASDTQINIPNVLGKSVLLDTHVTEYGGTGKRFDWSLATQFIRNNPELNVILAGGITPHNIAEAVAIKPYMIDVASGAESSPGIKDMESVIDMINSLG